MARKNRSETVFFRYDSGETKKDIYWRINPIAVRWQQSGKSAVSETLGGYFRDVFYSKDQQYSGFNLPDFTLEGTTGIAYRKELKTMDWVWRHSCDRKKDKSPVDIYFFDNINDRPFQEVQRSQSRAYLIHIQNFAWDDTVQTFQEIKFSIRCKILRDLFWELEGEDNPGIADNAPQLPDLNGIAKGARIPDFTPQDLRNPLGDITQLPTNPFTQLAL